MTTQDRSSPGVKRPRLSPAHVHRGTSRKGLSSASVFAWEFWHRRREPCAETPIPGQRKTASVPSVIGRGGNSTGASVLVTQRIARAGAADADAESTTAAKSLRSP